MGDGRYRMGLELVVRAPVRRVWHIITDYTAIKRLNPAVRGSMVISRDGLTLVRMRIRSCILFICFPITQTESMTTDGDTSVRGVIVPQLSSFRSGYSQWRLRPVAGGTEARFTASLAPSFYIPPLIGPWLIRLKLRDEMRATAARLRAWVDVKTPHKA
ncbi:SRPBCC family protein [Acidiphilium sp.]|uniref:SRPBCC family protein n=1 Tax=Acidiphilium sp. TaxID=527 RepID=UPI00258D5526|nr:SRPBCC family protein [Acidiphilium sp.]